MQARRDLSDEFESQYCPFRNKCPDVDYECERSLDYKFCNMYEIYMDKERMGLSSDALEKKAP